jgi:hypothetical protein
MIYLPVEMNRNAASYSNLSKRQGEVKIINKEVLVEIA